MEYIATFDDTLELSLIYEDANILEMSIEETVNPGDDFELGAAPSALFKVSLIDVDENIIFEQEVIKPHIGLKLTNTIEYVPLGVFIVDEIKKEKRTIKLTCFDNMVKLEKPYFSELTYPAPLNTVVQEICAKAGVTLATTNLPTTQIGNLSGYTLREAIGFIAAFLGGFARFNRDGQLEITSYTNSNVIITADNYASLDTAERTYSIGKLTCYVGEDEEGNMQVLTAGTTGHEVVFECPIMTQEQLNNIHATLSQLSYMPFNMEWQGNPALMAGDKITIIDAKDNTYNTLLMRQKIMYRGGLKATAEAVGKTEQAQEFRTTGTLTKKMERYVGEQALIKQILADKASIGELEAVEAKIDNLVVDTARIQDLAVTTAKIADAAVTNAKIANAAIDSAKIQDASITTAKIQDGAITNAKIGTAAIDTANIKDGAITSAKIGNAQIKTAHIEDLAVTTTKIADAAITTAKIGNAQITGAKIANATIETANIKDGAITSAKIGDLQVTNAKIANGAVDNAKIANLDASKITSGYISAARIAAGSITGDKIAANTITADKLNVTSLSAISANLGTVNVGGNNNVNGRIAILNSSGAEQAVMDVNGFLAKTGSTFRIDELGDGSETIIVAKANMVNDHSFEMLRTTGSIDPTHLDFAFGGDYSDNYFEWRASGSPRVFSRLKSGEYDPALTPFGFQAAIVNYSNRYEQYVAVWPSKTYTVSGYAYPHPTRNTSGATVRSFIVVDFYDAALAYISQVTSTKTLTTSLNAGSARNDMKRHMFTFTTPSNAAFVRIGIRGRTDGEWVVWDGIQLVEGDKSTVYNPEDQVWMLARGVSSGPKLVGPIIYDGAYFDIGTVRYVNYPGGISIELALNSGSGNAPFIVWKPNTANNNSFGIRADTSALRLGYWPDGGSYTAYLSIATNGDITLAGGANSGKAVRSTDSYGKPAIASTSKYSSAGAWVTWDYPDFSAAPNIIHSDYDNLGTKVRNVTASSCEVCMAGTATGYVRAIAVGGV